jgi:hypothetical protein
VAIQDKLMEVASQTALSTAGVGLKRVGNTIDTRVAANLGAQGGGELYAVIAVRTTVTSAGAATVAFHLVSDSVTPVAEDGTATTHLRTAAVPVAQLVAGFQFPPVALPPQGDRAYERYLGFLQDVGVAALTAGAVDIYFTPNPPGQWTPMPSA